MENVCLLLLINLNLKSNITYDILKKATLLSLLIDGIMRQEGCKNNNIQIDNWVERTTTFTGKPWTYNLLCLKVN